MVYSEYDRLFPLLSRRVNMKNVLFSLLALVILLPAGCSTDSSPPCSNPTAAQCLDDAYCADCEEKGIDIETVCGTALKAHYNASNRELALIPELSGSEETLRKRYDVSYADQSYLYVPLSITPETYYIRQAKFNLLNINDGILATQAQRPLIPDLEFNPSTSLIRTLLRTVSSKSATIINQLRPPDIFVQPEFKFDGLSYKADMIKSYLDNLYTGKVGAWNENGERIESCEEYTYEKFYDFSLFKDFMALHNDDHLRVAEYAYRGAALDASGMFVDNAAVLPGAIGSKFLSAVHLKPLSTTMGEIFQRKGGEPLSIFSEMEIFYYFDPVWGYSRFDKNASPDVSIDIYWDHVFSQNQVRMLCSEAKPECVEHPVANFMPKNFFVEVLGQISKTNTTRTLGIVLSNPGLLDMIGTDQMAYAMEAYDNNFKHHFLMLKAAKRLYSDSRTLKKKLLEFKLLRKHLIQLLAERARYENYSLIVPIRPSERILSRSETLPPSEKDYAAMKLDESINTVARAKAASPSKAAIIDIIDDPVRIGSVLQKIDEQIEALLLEAQQKGCLDIAIWDENKHNFPTLNNDGKTIDLLYDKGLCDWTPEMFTTAAVTMVPDVYYENIYADCVRVTGGDFEGMNVDNFRFSFPTDCEDHKLFEVWSPNTNVDYAKNTVTFHQLEGLVKKYPEAILDCDTIIQGQTKKELADAGMNYYDPVTGKVMMSKSRSYYDSVGGQYAGLEFGYSLGWLYEGYDEISGVQTQDIANRDFVCGKTGFFAFGNYFAGGSFLSRDFTLCLAGSYASNKTSGSARPVPPTLSEPENEDRINGDIASVASEKGVNTTYFMFIKNEKMTFNYDNGNFTQTPVKTTHSQPFSGDSLTYTSPAPEAQMLSVNVEKSVPVCGIISITIRGSVTGDIDAATVVNTDKRTAYVGDTCKTMDFSFTPELYFDAFAQASVTAGISGVASISAGVETGLRFIGIRFPYTTELSISQNIGTADDRSFNYDIYVNAYNNLDQEITLLSGFFGAFVKIEYIFDSNTYRQTLFSWDGIKFTGNLDRLGQNIDGSITPLAVPVKALYGLSKSLYPQ